LDTRENRASGKRRPNAGQDGAGASQMVRETVRGFGPWGSGGGGRPHLRLVSSRCRPRSFSLARGVRRLGEGDGGRDGGPGACAARGIRSSLIVAGTSFARHRSAGRREWLGAAWPITGDPSATPRSVPALRRLCSQAPSRAPDSWGSRTAPHPDLGAEPSCIAASRGVTSLRSLRPCVVWMSSRAPGRDGQAAPFGVPVTRGLIPDGWRWVRGRPAGAQCIPFTS
jgi:hypothetical protein